MFDEADLSAILISLKVASTAMLCSLPFAVAVAWLLARKAFRGKILVDALVHLPLVLPPVVTGYLLLIAFGRRGPAGQWLETLFGLVLSFRWTGAALAAAVMGFPLMVRAIRLSIEAVDPRLEEAAKTLGASRLQVFFRITLPLSVPGIVAGGILGFAKSLGEFGAIITFVSSIPGETRTLSAAIYGYTQVPGGEGDAMRLTLVAIVLALTAVAASELLARRVKRPGEPV